MVKKVFLTALLVALAAAVVVAEGMERSHHHAAAAKAHHSHHHARAYDHEEDEEEGEEEAVAAEGEEAFVEHAAHATTEQQQDADLVQALYKLVKQGSEQDKKLSTELSTEAAQSAALQTDLQAKQQQLARHQTLMKNLQICLAHGPDALAQSPAPTPFSALETHAGNTAKTAASAEGTCDCFKLKQQVADAKMALENSSNGEQVYKRQYEKAAAMLKATQKKLHKQKLRKKQPTQRTLCDSLKSCSACRAIDGCAWCGSSLGFGGVTKGKGMCRRMDVNARLRGHPKMDGLTSGECAANSWQTKVDTRLSSLSFNVFASDLKNARRRAHTVFALCKRTNPTFIAFQEVEDWFLQALKLEPWTQNYYQSDFGSGHAPGGLYILSKYPLSKVTYNEQTAPGQVQYDQRARVLAINAVIGQTPAAPAPVRGALAAPITPSAGAFVVTVATTTLDWRSADSRTDGLDFVMAVLSPFNDVLLVGDFNFDHGAIPETQHIPENWLDVWPALNPENLGHTWDPDTNRYARASDPSSRPSRIDRVLVKSVHWLPRTIRLVGCSSADLLCQGLFANPSPAHKHRPHALPQPLSQPHASTEANSPPLTALAKPKKHKKKHHKKRRHHRPRKDALGAGRSANSVFLELSQNAGDRIAAATTSWEQLEAETETEAEEDVQAVVIPSNHYGLLTHYSRFSAQC